MRKNCVQLLYPGETKLLITTLSLIEMQLVDAYSQSSEDAEKYMITWIQAATVFAQIWGVGGILDTQSRDKFDKFVKTVRKMVFSF